MKRPIKDALRPEVKALPSSGPLSMSDIQGEFDGSNPISLSEYYGAAPGVPSSGTISISDFYGKSSERVLSNLGDFFSFATVTSSAVSEMSDDGTGFLDAKKNWSSGFGTISWTATTKKLVYVYCTFYIRDLFKSPALSAEDAGKRIRIRTTGKWQNYTGSGGDTATGKCQPGYSISLDDNTPSTFGPFTMDTTLSGSNNGQVAFTIRADGSNGRSWRGGKLQFGPSRSGSDWILGG